MVVEPPAPQPPPEARYRVTFDATWSRQTHPTDYPSGAHFSPLVGATHAAGVTFWAEGTLASRGIRDMAERGRTTPLDQEVAAAIAGGGADRVLVGGGLNSLPGTVTLEFVVRQTHPLVTLVTMIAPSPDWFVGISGVALFQEGRWLDDLRVELPPWDAGTDSGTTFTSADRVTTPPQPVSRILGAPLSPSGRVTPLGTFRFERLDR